MARSLVSRAVLKRHFGLGGAEITSKCSPVAQNGKMSTPMVSVSLTWASYRSGASFPSDLKRNAVVEKGPKPCVDRRQHGLPPQTASITASGSLISAERVFSNSIRSHFSCSSALSLPVLRYVATATFSIAVRSTRAAVASRVGHSSAAAAAGFIPDSWRSA